MFFWIYTYCIVFLTAIFFNQKIVIRFLWFILFVIAAFRYNVGTDYDTYELMYNAFLIDDVPRVWQGKEPGFVAIIKILTFLGLSAQSLFVVTSFFILLFFYFGMYRLFKRQDSQLIILMLFFTFIYLTSLNVIRQFMAISIFAFLIYYIVRGNYLKYHIGVFFGALFHLSFFVVSPLYFLSKIRLSNNQIILVSIFIVALLFFNIIDAISSIEKYFKIKYWWYFQNLTNERTLTAKISFFISLFSSLLLIFLLNKNNKFENFLINSSLYFLFLNSILFYSGVAGRIGFYYKVIYLFTLVVLFQKYSARLKKYTINLIFITLLLLNTSYLIYTSYSRHVTDESYSHYTFNFSLFGEPYPMEVVR